MTKKITDIMNQESFLKSSKNGQKITPGQKISSSERKRLIEAIDNLFLKLELSYHYQFYKVFGTDFKLNEAKKLWAESLKKYPAECINAAVETVIQANDYLPTLTEILKACSGSKIIPTHTVKRSVSSSASCSSACFRFFDDFGVKLAIGLISDEFTNG